MPAHPSFETDLAISNQPFGFNSLLNGGSLRNGRDEGANPLGQLFHNQ